MRNFSSRVFSRSLIEIYFSRGFLFADKARVSYWQFLVSRKILSKFRQTIFSLINKF